MSVADGDLADIDRLVSLLESEFTVANIRISRAQAIAHAVRAEITKRERARARRSKKGTTR